MDRQTFNIEIINTQGKVGIYMCVKGTAELLVNGKLFLFGRGCIGLISPIIQIQILSQSSDCEFQIITEAIEHIFPIGKKFMDIILEIRQCNNVVFQADELFIDFVFQRERLIIERKSILENAKNEKEKRLYSSMIYLLEQELFVEVLAKAHQNTGVKPEEVDKNTSISFNFIFSINKNPTHNRSAFYVSLQIKNRLFS